MLTRDIAHSTATGSVSDVTYSGYVMALKPRPGYDS